LKAVRIHAHGGPEVLKYEEAEMPQPASGEAVVKIAAAGVNFIDIQQRIGKYRVPQLPYTIGSEGAGTVSAIGAGVTDVRVGDRVAYTMVPGT
jgi:NADPH2:quinone reductase